MPHLALKYTNNITQKIDLPTVAAALHGLVAATLDKAALDACSTRFEPIDEFYLADGNDQRRACVMLTIDIFTGRSLQQRGALADKCLAYLNELYAPTISQQKLDVFVEVREMHREACAKN